MVSRMSLDDSKRNSDLHRIATLPKRAMVSMRGKDAGGSIAEKVQEQLCPGTAL